MVAICFHCSCDVDTLENPKAGHAKDCPLWTNCMRCRKSYIEDEGSRIKSIKVRKWNFDKHKYFDVNICHTCESETHAHLFGNKPGQRPEL